jgi:predicted nucleic acid-binding protein
MKIVCIASPLILLSQINNLSVLAQLFGTVMVPEAVWREVALRDASAFSEMLKETRNKGVLEIFHVSNQLAVNATQIHGHFYPHK